MANNNSINNDIGESTGTSLELNGTLKVDGVGIKDANDNELMLFGTTASAVNEITTTNSATGAAVQTAATGDDANIDYAIVPKGTGSVGIGTLTPNELFTVAEPSGTQATIELTSGALGINIAYQDTASGRGAITNNNNSGGAANKFSLGFGAITAGVPANVVMQIDQTGLFELNSTTGVDSILDEDTLVTDSQTALATQQSIKAYVDGNINRKNLIIGGNFSTNPWQRGTSFPAIVAGNYTADRFLRSGSNDGVFSHLRTTDAPTVAESGVYGTYCLECDVTTGDATLSAGQYETINYRIEGYDFSYIAQQEFTFSFWVKASRADTYCVGFSNSGSDRSYVAEYTVATLGVWQKVEITIPSSPSAGTWNYTNGVGLEVWFTLGSGTTWQTTAGSWQTGLFFATSNQVNGIAANTDYLRIDQVQVEKGSVATPFEIRHRETELALCQRYFWKTFPQGTTPASALGSSAGSIIYRAQVASTTAGWHLPLSYPVCMRGTPTLTYYNSSAAGSAWRNLSVGANSGAASPTGSSDRGVAIANPQVAGDTVGSIINLHLTANAEL